MVAELMNSHCPADTSSAIWNMTAGDALRRAAQLAGSRTALVEVVPDGMQSLVGAESVSRRWTYDQLLGDAEACARWLLSKFPTGEHICLWAPNVPEWIVIQYGAALAGLVLVTANPALRESELRHVLQRSGAIGLIYTRGHRGNDMAVIADILAGMVRETILLERLHDLIDPYRSRGPLPDVSPNSPAQIQFTSGTSGRPKGALLHHRGMVTNAALLAERMGHSEDIVVTPMPLFHTAGSGINVLGCCTSLSTLVLPALFSPELMIATIAAERATITSGVPTMLSAMLDHLDDASDALTSLRLAFSGGSPVPPELHRRVERRFGCKLVSVYGQTELSPIVCATGPHDDDQDRASTSGRPLPQVEIRIADLADGCTPVAIGEEGEVQARGYQTMLEYFGQPEETAKTIFEDGWLRTGDIGSMDARGYVTISGRMSDMIIRGGENIYPAEVEAVLMRHPAINQIAIFGLLDNHWGETVAAGIVFERDVELPSVADLKAFCRAECSPQKTPTSWFAIEALPLTSSGKVQKFALQERAVAGDLEILT